MFYSSFFGKLGIQQSLWSVDKSTSEQSHNFGIEL
jgi:hypothetical protein